MLICYWYQSNIAFSQRPSMSVSILYFNSSFTRNSEANFALSRCGLRQPCGKSERSRHTRRFPRKQEVCKKASRQFPPPCRFVIDINKIISYLREHPVRSECTYKSTLRLKLRGSACVIPLRTSSASRAMYPPPCGYYLFFL